MDTLLQLAHDGNYDEFANTVKDNLKTRLANNEVVKSYVKQIQTIQNNKLAFKNITENCRSEA